MGNKSVQYPLTQEQESLLAHGPNFAVTIPKTTPGEYFIAIEIACQSLDANTVEELRADIYRVLRLPHQLKPNLSKDEIKAVKQLKADNEWMVLTAKVWHWWSWTEVIISGKPKNY